MISEDEFTALPPGEVEGEEFQAMDKTWKKERQEEFHNSMDVDHNGKVTREELKVCFEKKFLLVSSLNV